ncbi:MAG: bifunctional riboflavin kinase/FAD synthetase [Bacillota bacterium]
MEILTPDKAEEIHRAAATGTVVALGVFDGVHLGHQELFKEAARQRSSSGLPLVAMTFAPHPRTLTGNPNGYDKLLTPLLEKSALLEDAGADYLLVIPFTRELASTPPKQFAEVYLAGQCRAKHVVCGFNFTFGHKGAGTPEDLVQWGREMGFAVSVVPPFSMDDSTVSSTRVRTALDLGRVPDATMCLGRPYCLCGVVDRGDGRGKRIGIPTSNLSVPEDKFLPATGVYAGIARVKADSVTEAPTAFLAVVNIGTRPTFGGCGVRVEVHIPGFSGELYGRPMQVFLTEYLREEQRFEDAASLRKQVRLDIERAAAASGKVPSFTLPGAYDRMLASELP